MGSQAMHNSIRSKNKPASVRQNVSGEQTEDALSPPFILMTGTDESKVESMQDRFNYGPDIINVNKGAGSASGQSPMRCNTVV